MRHALRAAIIALSLVAVPVAAQDKPAATAATIETGATVDLEYTLKDEAGAVIDSNKGKDPLRYTHGGRQLIPGLERELTGLHPGDEKKVVVKPEDGYGSVNPDARAEVPKASIPPNALVVGTRLLARSQSGETRPVMVKEIKETTVTLDLNHPLAGKTLFFDVKVLGVARPGEKREPPAPPAKPAN
jgi:FKBP-type peptidyl-prolyl cis-trans isomerase 2